MTADPRRELYDQTLAQLRPALERVASDPAFRARLESSPLAALDEMKVPLDPGLRAELEGKRFSEFWAARRQMVEGPVEIRDLPPEPAPDAGSLSEAELAVVSGGISFPSLGNFAPPYIPVGNLSTGDNIVVPPPIKKW